MCYANKNNIIQKTLPEWRRINGTGIYRDDSSTEFKIGSVAHLVNVNRDQHRPVHHISGNMAKSSGGHLYRVMCNSCLKSLLWS